MTNVNVERHSASYFRCRRAEHNTEGEKITQTVNSNGDRSILGFRRVTLNRFRVLAVYIYTIARKIKHPVQFISSVPRTTLS